MKDAKSLSLMGSSLFTGVAELGVWIPGRLVGGARYRHRCSDDDTKLLHDAIVGEPGKDLVARLADLAALAGDEPMRAFAAELDDRFVFVDLRSPPVGMGFS